MPVLRRTLWIADTLVAGCAFVVFGAASTPGYAVNKYRSLRECWRSRVGAVTNVDNNSLQVSLLDSSAQSRETPTDLEGASTVAEPTYLERQAI